MPQQPAAGQRVPAHTRRKPRSDMADDSGGGAFFDEASVAAPPFHLEVQADERRFVSLSGHTAKQLGLSGMILVPGAGMVPLLSSDTGTAPGTHAWKEVSEIDAQGLMSIARVVLPPAESR